MDDPESKCDYPNCETIPDHTHHITYEPELTVRLCRKHHEDITIINGAKARATRSGWNWRFTPYRKLTNWEREYIYEGWKAGTFRPKRTKKALEWLKDWDKFDRAPA